MMFFSWDKRVKKSVLAFAMQSLTRLADYSTGRTSDLPEFSLIAVLQPPSAKMDLSPHPSAWSSSCVQKYSDRQGIALLGRERLLCLQMGKK